MAGHAGWAAAGRWKHAVPRHRCPCGKASGAADMTVARQTEDSQTALEVESVEQTEDVDVAPQAAPDLNCMAVADADARAADLVPVAGHLLLLLLQLLLQGPL